MTLPFWLAALFGFLIIARATRFVNDDVLAAGLRSWVLVKFGDGKMYYLATCPWCLSIWTALPVSAIVVLAPMTGAFGAIWTILGLWLGYSYVYGLVAQNLDGE